MAMAGTDGVVLAAVCTTANRNYRRKNCGGRAKWIDLGRGEKK